MFLLFAGCYQWPTVTPDPLDTTSPQIVDASVTCDVATAQWSFALDTDAWSGGGKLSLSADGEYVEQHTLTSTSAAADGTSDRLERDLAIVATWRDAAKDTSTAFACDAAGLAGILDVYSRDGSALTSCLAFGTDPARWQTWNADLACTTVMLGETWPNPDSGDTGS